MARYILSDDFRLSHSGSVCHFTFDTQCETLSLVGVDTPYIKSCGSEAEANRIILANFPELWEQGVRVPMTSAV